MTKASTMSALRSCRYSQVIFALMLFPSGMLAQAPGTLDESFDGDGKLVLADTPGAGWALIRADNVKRVYIAYQVAGNPVPLLHVRRLLDDGALDSTFSDDGIAVIEDNGALVDMAVESDGRIVVLTNLLQTLGHPRLTRISWDGSLDSTFNAAQQFLPNDGLDYCVAKRLIPLVDGRIVVGGTKHTPQTSQSWLALVQHVGQPDPDFGLDGFRLLALGHLSDFTVQVDGLVWIAQSEGAYFFKATPFINAGIEPQYLGSSTERIAGKVVQSVSGALMFQQKEYIPSSIIPGSVVTFGVMWRKYLGPGISGGTDWLGGGHGLFMAGPYNTPQTGNFGSLSTDQAGNFHVGFTHFSGPGWCVRRLAPLSNGADEAFGGPGGVYTEFATGQYAYVSSMCVQADGKLLVAGRSEVDSANRVVIARYHNIPDPRTRVELRMMLGGAYDAATGLMRDDLRQQGLVPSIQPYGLPFFSSPNGVGSWLASPHALQAEGDTAIVDWVWLELLSATDSSSVLAARAALLRRDGSVVSSSGSRQIDFSAGAGNYFVRVRHRNHLRATSLEPISLGAWTTTLDFTNPAFPIRGDAGQMEVNGTRMLWPGDTNTNAYIRYVGQMNDRDRILVALGGSPLGMINGYHPEDTNLDGQVKYVGSENDRDVILQTLDGNLFGQRFSY